MTSIVPIQSQIDYILLDSSSSMMGKWTESLSAIDTFIESLRAASLNPRIIFQMAYSQNPDYIHRNCPLESWTPISIEPPAPQGLTPLYDSIIAMGRRLRTLDPPRCSILIITDGDDNASAVPLSAARRVLDWIRAKNYSITFLGADFSNSHQAELLGASAASAIGVQRLRLSDAIRSLATKRHAHALYGSPISFSPSEQQQFGGYLEARGDR